MHSLTFLSAWFCESHGQCWLRLPEATQNNKCIYTVCVKLEAAEKRRRQKNHKLFLYSQATCWWERSWGKNLPPRTRSSRSRPATVQQVQPTAGEVWSRIKKPVFGCWRPWHPWGVFPYQWPRSHGMGILRTFLLQEGKQQKPPPSPLKSIHPTHLTHRHSLHQQSVHLEFWGGTTMSRLPKKKQGSPVGLQRSSGPGNLGIAP